MPIWSKVTEVWPALLSFWAGLGLNRDNTDEGTLLLSLNLQNDSNGEFGFLSTCLGNDTPAIIGVQSLCIGS